MLRCMLGYGFKETFRASFGLSYRNVQSAGSAKCGLTGQEKNTSLMKVAVPDLVVF